MKIIMETKELKEIIKTAKKFVAKYGVRPSFMGMHFECKDNVCTVKALDGYKAVEMTVDCTVEGEGWFIVPIIDVPKSKFVEITENENDVIFSFDRITNIAVRKIIADGVFCLDKHIPKEEPIFKIGIDPKLLKEVCDGMQNDKGIIELDFYSPTAPIIIKGTNKRGLVMPKQLK